MEERRTDYPKILDALEDIKKEITEDKLNTAKVATLVEERNNTAIVWRGDVCKKFDKIFKWLEELPCKERSSKYDALTSRVKVMSWLFVVLVLVLFIDVIKFHMTR